jgi:OCT family organic cation transporter-like MFS transporter 4/5
LRASADSLFMLGVLLGSIIFGHLSDKMGRKPIFFASLVIQVVFGILAGISPEYLTYTFSRIVVGATTSGVFLVAYVISMEMVGPNSRLFAGIICMMFFSCGNIFRLYKGLRCKNDLIELNILLFKKVTC